MTRTIRYALAPVAVFVLAVTAVFAYGYWHTETHAILDARLRDGGERVRLQNAELTFLGNAGVELARAAADQGVFYISHPASFSCRDIERAASFVIGGHEAYSRCFTRQTRWISTWIDDVKYANVKLEACEWAEVPVKLERSPTGPEDWWIFWPVHMGGSPYTRYTATIVVDSRACQSGMSP